MLTLRATLPAVDLSAVTAAVQQAQATADNARQMVLNRDPSLTTANTNASDALAKATSLEQVAASVQQLNAASVADRQSLHDQLDALAARPYVRQISTGQAKTASLLALGASTDVTVTLTKPMPSASYQVMLMPLSTALLSAGATLTVKTQTASAVTVTVTALAAVAAQSALAVLAWT